MTLSESAGSKQEGLLQGFLPYVWAVLIAFLAVGVVLFALGYDVVRAYSIIILTPLSSLIGLSQTFLKFTPILLLGLAFVLPAKTDRYNIGGQGQMIFGAIGAATVGILAVGSGVPAIVLVPLTLIIGTVFGGIWAAIPAYLLYKFSVNEVLSTVLMNFVGISLISYVATNIWPEPFAGYPTSVPIAAQADLPALIKVPLVNIGFLLAIAVSVLAYVLIDRTFVGYQLRATGANPRASFVHGINVKEMTLLALVIGGAVAGLAGAIEVTGTYSRLIVGLDGNYLVLGMIAGLISRNRLDVLPFVSFFLAIIEVGAGALQQSMSVPVELFLIFEALIIVILLLTDLLKRGGLHGR